MTKFLEERYKDIMLMSKKICRSHVEWDEDGHYCIEKFMLHERAQELVDTGRAMQFISGIIHRSFHSSTSQYHTDIRQKNRMHGLPPTTQLESGDILYDHEIDNVTSVIQTILEEMVTNSKESWFASVLFQMYAENPNFSKISRETGIPRTTVSRAVEEARSYIKEELKNRGIDYD